ncbi:MAG: efflux RND transporter periplasmic adaptor subunit, partial [Balneolaceae bacterium]
MANRSSTKTLIYVLVILIVALGVLAVLAKTMGWMDNDGSEYTVQTEIAALRTISQEVAASGRIQPEVEVIIRPDVSGEIIELNVIEGDYVREGDLLLRIKPDIYEARIDELNAQLLTQRARMEQTRSGLLQAEAEHVKNQELYERKLISEIQYLQSKNNYESQKASLNAAEYQIESASAQLRRAKEELEQTVIRAPQAGTISSLAVEQGERVLGQAQTAGTEMMRIVRMEQMEMEVEVNENDIIHVSIDDTASIEVDAYPNRSFEGIVTEIANSADITGSGSAQQVTNFMVKIRITTPHNLEDNLSGTFIPASFGTG